MRSRIESLFRRRWAVLALVMAAALLPRLVFVAVSPHPGPWDPTHYYLLGRNLHEGRGFVIDYIWHYADNPPAVTHPTDHWMPLAGLLVAGGMAVGGESVLAALLPFALLGALQAGLAAWFARKVGLSLPGQLLAGFGTAFLPWLFLSSLHSDTTTPFGVLAFGSLALLWLGLREDGRWLWISGALAGLATLTRNDGLLLLPTLAVSAVLFKLGGQYHTRWGHLAGFMLAFGLVLLPWVLRNQAVLGTPWPGSIAQSAFVRDHEEFYSYATPITLAHYLEWGLPNIVGKMAFELAASLKLMVTLAGSFFGVALGGVLIERMLGARRRRQRLRTAHAAEALVQAAESPAAPHAPPRRSAPGGAPGGASPGGAAPGGESPGDPASPWPFVPALVFLLGAWSFYGIVTPFLSQAGSFKKAYLGVLPFLLILAAEVVTRYVRPRAAVWALVVLVSAFTALDAVDLTRQDFAENARYAAAFVPFGAALDALQAEMDHELILMTRDPWSVQYVTGYRAIMVPDDSLDVILDVADRYGATHILLPVPRPALQDIYDGTETHPRLRLAARIEDTIYRIYAIEPP